MSPSSSVALFFAASLTLTALCQTPGILAMRSGTPPGGVAMLLLAIGSAGPTLVALALASITEGRAGVRALFARRGRPTWPFYAIALLHIVAAHLVATIGLVLAGSYSAEHVLYPPLRPEQIAIAVVAPLGEEYGWRGFALPRLQSVMKPLPASLVIGVAWAVWHLPTFFAPGASLSDLFLTLPAMLAGSVIYTWMYNATGGSMRVVLLAHLGVHLDNVFRAAAAGDGLAPLASTSVVLVLFAAALVSVGALREDQAVTAELARAPA
jgi:membrane protease YdiL (CAAX protease family)